MASHSPSACGDSQRMSVGCNTKAKTRGTKNLKFSDMTCTVDMAKGDKDSQLFGEDYGTGPHLTKELKTGLQAVVNTVSIPTCCNTVTQHHITVEPAKPDPKRNQPNNSEPTPIKPTTGVPTDNQQITGGPAVDLKTTPGAPKTTSHNSRNATPSEPIAESPTQNQPIPEDRSKEDESQSASQSSAASPKIFNDYECHVITSSDDSIIIYSPARTLDDEIEYRYKLSEQQSTFTGDLMERMTSTSILRPAITGRAARKQHIKHVLAEQEIKRNRDRRSKFVAALTFSVPVLFMVLLVISMLS